MKIAIDIDGVLACFNSSFAELIIRESGENRFPKDWLQGIKDNSHFPPCWDYPEHFGYDKTWYKNHIWGKCVGENPKFWESLHPMSDVYQVLEKFNRMADNGNEVYFITNRVGIKCKRQTERWLHQRGMLYPCVLLSADKVPLLRYLGVNLFIDDKLETIADVARVAEEEKWPDFKLYLKDAPYNREGRNGHYTVVSGIREMMTQEELWR